MYVEKKNSIGIVKPTDLLKISRLRLSIITPGAVR